MIDDVVLFVQDRDTVWKLTMAEVSKIRGNEKVANPGCSAACV